MFRIQKSAACWVAFILWVFSSCSPTVTDISSLCAADWSILSFLPELLKKAAKPAALFLLEKKQKKTLKDSVVF